MSKYIVDIHGEIEGDYEIVGKYEEQEPTTKNDLSHNLCDSCINYRCEFQSGIVRTKCAFYMPPQLEPDNCGKSVLDKIRAEIAELSHYYPMGHDYQIAITRCLAVVDKYKVGSEYKK